ncbi:MAG: ABC transporter substrate-binding protein, partial [Acidimicrobiales bacterium]
MPTLDRRRFLILSTVGGAGTLLLGACGGKSGSSSSSSGSLNSYANVSDLAPAERPAVRIPFGSFGFPSPFASNGGIGYIQMSLIYDTLLWRDETGELLPWLAKSLTKSTDNLTYTFELRDNVKWSDGKPFTADDVVFTFDYFALQETLPPPVVSQPPKGISKVTATGPSTIAITLTAPDVTFPEQVAGTIPIVPKHIWSAIVDPTEPADPALLVGTGAYKLASYTSDSEALQYTANDDYFLGAPFVKSITFNGLDDPFTGLLSGDTDTALGSGTRPDILAPFQNDSSYGIITNKGASSIALYWNLKTPPDADDQRKARATVLADKRFRQACAHAIDSKDLVTRFAGGNAQTGNAGFLGPDNPFLASVKQYDYDVAAANTALDSAGYAMGADGIRATADGTALSFELIVSILDTALGEVLAAALKKIGVGITLMPVEPGPQLFGPKFSGGFEMVALGFPGPSPGGPNGDPDLLRRVFSSKAGPSLTSASGYVNPTFDTLAEQQRTTFDETQRKTLVNQMQQIIAEDIPVYPLYAPDSTFVFRKSVLDQ